MDKVRIVLMHNWSIDGFINSACSNRSGPVLKVARLAYFYHFRSLRSAPYLELSAVDSPNVTVKALTTPRLPLSSVERRGGAQLFPYVQTTTQFRQISQRPRRPASDSRIGLGAQMAQIFHRVDIEPTRQQAEGDTERF